MGGNGKSTTQMVILNYAGNSIHKKLDFSLNNSQLTKSKYRKDKMDLELLYCAVILNHFNKDILPGGI